MTGSASGSSSPAGSGPEPAVRRAAGGLLLPALTGLLLALSFPPLHLVLPPFVALVPLAVWLDGAADTGPGRTRRTFRAGALAGAVAWGLLLAWIPPALWRWSWIAVPGYLAVVAGLAAVTGAAAVAAGELRARGVPLPLAVAVGWTAGEWLRAHLPGSLAFPWLELGVSMAATPEWAGVAELVGSRGLSFWLAAVSGLVAAGWVASGRGRTARWAGAVVLAVAVPAWGTVRAASVDARAGDAPTLAVAVVQPNVAQTVRREPGVVEAATREALTRLLPRVGAGTGPEAGRDPPRGAGSTVPDLVVLPEALLPDTLAPEGPVPAALEPALVRARELGVPVLVGGLGVAGEGADRALTNSVFLLGPGGLEPYRDDKRHLVPAVERVPLVPAPWLGPGFTGYRAGRGFPLARVGLGGDGGREATLGAMICFESAFPRVARGLAGAGAGVLVNLTNDAWFGTPDGGRTAALRQHPAHLVLRAVETRRAVVRAANTGISMIVDPVGRVRAETPLFREAVLEARVPVMEGTTGYVRRGDVAGWGSTAAALLGLLLGVRGGGAPPAPSLRHIPDRRG